MNTFFSGVELLSSPSFVSLPETDADVDPSWFCFSKNEGRRIILGTTINRKRVLAATLMTIYLSPPSLSSHAQTRARE